VLPGEHLVRRVRCGNCGSTRLETVLDLGKTPPANSLPANPDDPETFYPLQLGVCADCWLAQQMEIVPDDVLYSHDYAFYSSASLPKQAYHRDLSRRLYRDHTDQARRLTVEIACNDGDLLRHFRDVGCNVLGVDPAPGPAQVATNRGLPVVAAPFGIERAETILANHGPAGLIVANHVAAHVADLNDLFGGIDLLLATDGVVVVEVQYLTDLLVGNQLDHVYHEHRYHFSLTALERLAERHHLFVHDVQHTPAQSGSISVTFGRDLNGGSPRVNRIRLAERWLRDMSAYQSLQGRAEHIRSQLRDLLAEEQRAGRRLAGYAAPAKATTLLNFCGIGPETLEFVVDTTPYKAGRYIPGVRVPIVGRRWDGTAQGMYEGTVPDGYELPATWLVLAWNYLGDILRRERAFTANGGRWVAPIPVPVLL
jgi:C-methyltransferase-like protein/putative zinc binding protein/methyltransferase family protein